MPISDTKRTGVRGRRGGATFRLIALAVSLLLLVAACGGAEESSEPGAAESGAAGGATDAAGGDGEPVELTVWFARDYIPPDEFASLEEEHNIRVTYDVRPDDNILQTLVQMRDAGEKLPDLIEDDTNVVPAYVGANLLAPMTEHVERFQQEDPELYDTVLPQVWEQGTFDGEIYQAAVNSAYDLIYYDVEALEAAGVEVPFESWQDVLEGARAVKESDPGRTTYFGTGGTSHDNMFYFMYGFGVPFEGNVPDLTSPQGLEFIEWGQAMQAEGLWNPAIVVGEQDESQGAWIAGDGAILQDGVNAGIDYMNTPNWEYETNWLSSPLPNNEGGAQMSVPRGWSIVSESEHPYEASLALRYLMETENALPRYLLGSSTPRLTEVIESEDVAEAQPYFTEPIREQFLAVEEQLPTGTNTGAVGEVLINLRDELFVVGTDDAPEDIAARYQAELDELRQ